MNKLFFGCIITVALTSCGPSQKVLDAREDALFNKWLNHSKAQLVQNWGQPDSTKADGKGGEILIYKEGIDYKSVMNEKYTGKQYSLRKEMYINSDSLIYNWKAWRRK
ncbi:MAG TPA: hypothetical protein VMY77_03225 [Chitinophagaceae bacterium]|nr:hypothetical protein [Chitinophagaceae bacterium]